MNTFYLICAAGGGTVLLFQVIAGLFGLGGDHDTDADADHDSSFFFGLLGIRTVASALTFFGLGGLSADYYGASEPVTISVAVASAVAAFFAVALIVRSLGRLKADGTVRIERAIGCTGSVYLRIPGSKTGTGKVQLSVQRRTVELQAVTAGPELPTGVAVRVVAVVNSDTVEVEAA
jgi:hypothetical protein